MFLIALCLFGLLCAFGFQLVRLVLEPGYLYLARSFWPEPRIVPQEIEQCPLVARGAFGPSVHLLEAEGFRVLASAQVQDSRHEKSYVVVMQRAGTSDRALVRAVVSSSYALKDICIELRTELSGGRCVRTLDPSRLPPFGAEKHAVETLVPSYFSLHRLLETHRAVCAQHPASPREEPAEDALELLRRLAKEERASWLERGLVVLDERSGVLRLTYNGACQLSWGQLWPLANVRRNNSANDAWRKTRLPDVARRI